MRLLLPAPGFPPLFYEIDVVDEPASLVVTGFNHRHRAVSQADVRPEGEFALVATLSVGEISVAVRAALSQTGGGLAAIEGTLNDQPFKFVNTPSRRPHVFALPTLGDAETATLARWQGVSRGLRVLAFALRSSESIDDAWSAAPCHLALGAVAVGVSSFMTAAADATALGAYQEAVQAADARLVQGNCVQSVPPLSDVEPT